MTCQDCGTSKYPPSPIEGICVVCATRNWRLCRTQLTEFRLEPEHEVEDPSSTLESFLEGIPDKTAQKLRDFGVEVDAGKTVSNLDWDNDPHQISSKKMRMKGIKGIKNMSKDDLPSKVIESLYLLDYEVWESKKGGSTSVFFKEKDVDLTEDCDGFFRPEYMYQLYCDTCWDAIEKRRAEKIRKIAEAKGEKPRKQTYRRNCIVCNSSFTTERPSHYLCGNCHHDWLSCSGGCGSYFRPYKQRFSESYCPECRGKVPEKDADLLTRVAEKIDVELHFNHKRKFGKSQNT